MKNIEEILIAVELDNESEEIIEYGITLGLMLNANVRCVHVARPLANRMTLDDDINSVDSPDYPQENDLSAFEELMKNDDIVLNEKICNVLERLDLDDHLIPFNVRADFAIPGILNEATEHNSDLILVGAHVDFKKKNHGITNLSKDLIERSDVPVIVVPSSYTNGDFDHICVFINFEFDELSLIKEMCDLSSTCDVQVSFVHVLNKDEKKSVVEAKIDVYNNIFAQLEGSAQIEFKVIEGDVPEVLEMLNDTMKVDLIVLKSMNIHWKYFGLQNSFGDKIMDEIKIPLLVW